MQLTSPSNAQSVALKQKSTNFIFPADHKLVIRLFSYSGARIKSLERANAGTA